MGPTPPRRPVLAAVTLALLATGTAAPAQARPLRPGRMPGAPPFASTRGS